LSAVTSPEGRVEYGVSVFINHLDENVAGDLVKIEPAKVVVTADTEATDENLYTTDVRDKRI